jgi:type II secretory ATPase GspE/PulE/Tfp pilus assembly ATPase PilB-like protein
MPAPTTDISLPDALAALLSEDARRQIAETPLEKRQERLASALGLTESAAIAKLAAASGLGLIEEPVVQVDALRVLPARFAKECQLLPVQPPPGAATGTDELHLAAVWPPSVETADWLATFTSRPLRWYLAPGERLRQLITDHYGVGSDSLEESAEQEGAAAPAATLETDADADAVVVRFVTEVIAQAVEVGATDIHFEPQEGQLRIRYRVDGLLVPVPLPDNLLRFQDAVISRLKIMARLNISERRLPQDGRIDFRAGGAAVDIRVSTIPTIYAESVSLRLLNKRKEAYTMDILGMSQSEQAQIIKVLDYPHGLVLVTGPTGSGKSTSLNAFLRKINSPDLRIVTIEDPIEYEVPGANQMQTRPEIGLTFAGALRHVLRQDPDVIMVGEIRDLETAEIAIRASLTGHLVFSTLHTNDAPGAVTRLVDMGLEPFLVASALELVIAQRLVRRLCPDCTRKQPIDAARLRVALTALGLPPEEADGVTELCVPVGCHRCRGTGYRGRVGIFEILHPKPLHELIIHRESNRALTAKARELGMTSLTQSGWEKAKAGLTTVEELVRVTSTGDI